ncbi:hypothetical protein T492DRAFT_1070539, partial [Pavlovales sp. CCMP2436]
SIREMARARPGIVGNRIMDNLGAGPNPCRPQGISETARLLSAGPDIVVNLGAGLDPRRPPGIHETARLPGAGPDNIANLRSGQNPRQQSTSETARMGVGPPSARTGTGLAPWPYSNPGRA